MKNNRESPGGMLRALVTALILVLAPASAGAAATYQWQSVGQGGSGDACCTAILEITNEAYAAGAVSVAIDYSGPPIAMPQSPVIRFEWTGYGDRIAFDRTAVRGRYDFAVDLKNGTLTGRIRANDLSTDTLLDGATDIWGVKAHHADHPGDCFRADNTCAGAAGRWVLISPPME